MRDRGGPHATRQETGTGARLFGIVAIAAGLACGIACAAAAVMMRARPGVVAFSGVTAGLVAACAAAWWRERT